MTAMVILFCCGIAIGVLGLLFQNKVSHLHVFRVHQFASLMSLTPLNLLFNLELG